MITPRAAGLHAIPHSKPGLEEQDWVAVLETFASGQIAQGSKCHEFEAAIADFLEAEGAVATGSGTTALFLALMALDVRPGDEVILPTYVCRSVYDAVLWSGASPVLCDIGEDWCLDAATVHLHLTKRTKAIIAVHMFGLAADLHALQTFGVPIIEDCAHALGGSLDGRKLGTIGAFGIYSFHATKLLTTGEGGMVVAGDRAHLDRLRRPAASDGIVYRFPLSDLQAALGLSQLRRFDGFLQRRQAIAATYLSELDDLPVTLPTHLRHRSIFFRFPILTGDPFLELQAAFQAKGIQIRRGVDQLLHRLLGLNPAKFPGAERQFEATLSLPIYPALTDAEVGRIVAASRAIWGQSS